MFLLVFSRMGRGLVLIFVLLVSVTKCICVRWVTKALFSLHAKLQLPWETVILQEPCFGRSLCPAHLCYVCSLIKKKSVLGLKNLFSYFALNPHCQKHISGGKYSFEYFTFCNNQCMWAKSPLDLQASFSVLQLIRGLRYNIKESVSLCGIIQSFLRLEVKKWWGSNT